METPTTIIPPPAVIMPEVDKPAVACEPGQYLPDTSNCNAFYRCVLGELKKQYCAGGLHWNKDKNICDWPNEANCNDQKRKKSHRFYVRRIILPLGFTASYVSRPTTSNWQQTRTTPPSTTRSTTLASTASLVSQITEASSAEVQEGCTNGAYYPHADCNHFYVCFNDQLVAQTCAPGLMYDVDTHMCDWSFKVKCGQRKKIAEMYTILHRMSIGLKESKHIVQKQLGTLYTDDTPN